MEIQGLVKHRLQICSSNIITMSRTIMRVEDERGDSLLYGYSYLLAWVSFLVSASAAVLFLLASRKRKLLDSDQVNYNNQQLDIEVKT